MKKIILSISFILFSAVAVGVRIFELLFMLDKQSGFYLDKFSIISVILAVIALVGCVNFAIGAIVTLKDESKERIVPKNSIILGISSLLVALSIFYDIGKIALNTVEYSLSNYAVFGLSFFSAVVFTIYGVCYFAGKNCPVILSVIPVIWSVGRLIINYTQFNGIALASENITDIITLAFFMVFWLYHSKFFGNQDSKKTLTRIFIFGTCSAILGLVSTLPRFFVDYSMRVDLISTTPMISFSNLAGAIYVICFIGVLYLQNIEKPSSNNTNLDGRVSSSDILSQFTIEVIEDFDVEDVNTEEN